MIKNQYVFFYPELSSQVNVDEKLAFQFSKVLRLKTGDSVMLINGKGTQSEYRIEKAEKDFYSLKQMNSTQKEKQKKLILALALIRKEKLEWVLQKATELGVSQIILFNSENSIAKTKNDLKKLKRYERIIIEALEQSKGFYLPELKIHKNLHETFDSFNHQNINFFMAEQNTHKKLTDYKEKLIKDIVFFIGPEGGFSNKELDFFKMHKIPQVKLSQQILRAETAAITAVAGINLLRLD